MQSLSVDGTEQPEHFVLLIDDHANHEDEIQLE